MWQALNLKNLSEQASNLVAQATEKSGELISQAQDSLRKISNDNDNQVINEDQVMISTQNQDSCPTLDGNAESSDTHKKIAEKADEIADNFFNFASKFVDNTYTNLSQAAAQAQETANLAHEIAVESAGKLQENQLIGGLVKTIEAKTFIGDFNGLQQGFIGQNQEKNNKQAGFPWENYDNAEELKEKILAISSEKRNFLRNPPAGVRFKFDYQDAFPTALRIIEVDPNLSKMRFELVPKKLTEEIFWRNYFYRVSLVTQSSTLKQLSKSQENLNQVASVEASQTKDLPGSDKERKRNEESVNISEDGEFVSQENTEMTADDLQKEMEALGMDGDKDWEKELAAELDEYEVVDSAEKNEGKDSSEWEKELNDMLNDA